MTKEKITIKKLINPLFIFEFNRIRIELPIETHKEEIEEYLNGLTFEKCCINQKCVLPL